VLASIYSAQTEELVVANSQMVTINEQLFASIRNVGQNRNCSFPNSTITYDTLGGLTPNNKTVDVFEKPNYQLYPQVIGNKAYRTIIAEDPAGTATVNNSNTDIKSPFGGSTVTGVTTTGTNQYARTYLSNGAWSANQWINGIVYLYIPTAFTGTLSVSLVGSGGTELLSNISYYPKDKWFYVVLRNKATGTSTSTDFRITASDSGQSFYMYRPSAFIADTDIEPFIAERFPDAIPSGMLEPTLFPGTGGYFGANKIHWGSGDPESNVIGRIGDLYLRTDGGSSTVIYVKEADAGLNTGWAAK
jgi:hypothetical protein